MKKINRYDEVVKLMRQLGMSEEVIKEFRPSESSDYTSFLKEKGAKQEEEHVELRGNLKPECIHSRINLPGGNVVAISQNPDDGKWYVLVQKRADGGKIGLPGGGIYTWTFNGIEEQESPVLAADREFGQEVGIYLPSKLNLTECGTNISKTTYGNTDITTCISFFYKAELSWEFINECKDGGSEEGKMALIPVEEILNYELFENHEPIFEKLYEELCEK